MNMEPKQFLVTDFRHRLLFLETAELILINNAFQCLVGQILCSGARVRGGRQGRPVCSGRRSPAGQRLLELLPQSTTFRDAGVALACAMQWALRLCADVDFLQACQGLKVLFEAL